MNADDNTRSIFSFIRRNDDDKNRLLFVINFTPIARDDYCVGVPEKKTYKLILNSEDPKFGGSDTDRPLSYKAVAKEADNHPYSIRYPLPAYGVAVFKF